MMSLEKQSLLIISSSGIKQTEMINGIKWNGMKINFG